MEREGEEGRLEGRLIGHRCMGRFDDGVHSVGEMLHFVNSVTVLGPKPDLAAVSPD